MLVFAATAVLPGDAAGALAGPEATMEERARIQADLGLDRPPVERYLDWAGGVLRGDLGTAWVGGRPVTELLADRVPASLLLAGLALLVLIPVGLAVGLWIGLRRRSSVVVLVAVAVPEFLTAALLAAVFGAWLGWLPQVSLVPLGGSALAAPEVLVSPVACLALAGAAMTARVLRGAVTQVSGAPYVEAARLNGVRGVRLALRHVLPAAAGPAVQVIATAVGGLVGGAVVVETVFAYPGVGQELAQAVARRDVPVVQGLALVLAAVALLALLAGDVVRRMVEAR